MIEYYDNLAIFDGISFNKDKKTGYYLSTKNTDSGHRERLHVYVWRKANGVIPKGYHIHHKDENKNNNDLVNLICISQREHQSFHRKEYVVQNADAVKRNLKKNAVPAAIKWHKSAQGHEWHVLHGHETMKAVQNKECVCENCGNKYIVKTIGMTKYCSNKCKSEARRNSGIDNEERKCVFCEKKFITNKYSKKKFCSKDCRKQYGWLRK